MNSNPPARQSTAGRTLSVVGGTIAGFVAIGLLIAGGVVLWINGHKDHDGYVSTASERFETSTYAIATDNLDVNIDAPGWIINRDRYGKVRLRATSHGAKPIFVGIAPTKAVSAYLDASAHAAVTDISYPSFKASYTDYPGGLRPAPPASKRFWVASAHGAGKQTLSWQVKRGDWSIVVMNADGSRGVDARVSAGARLPFLTAVGWSAMGGGLLLLAAAGGLVYVGLRRPRPRPDAAGTLDLQPAPA
jgi:hypothetical protein